MRRSLLLFVLAVTASSCAPQVRGVRMGAAYAAYAPDCSLELRADTMTASFLAEYEMVGTLMVAGETGEAPNSARILALVKPAACNWGGEIVSITTSANLENRMGMPTNSSHSFLVFRKKSVAAAPQTF